MYNIARAVGPIDPIKNRGFRFAMGLVKAIQRRWRSRRGFPPTWSSILEANIPYYRCLPQAERDQLHQLILVFIHEKWFEGAMDLKITDEIRLTIAAQACTLLLNREAEVYPKLRTVIVYPEAYRAKNTVRMEEGTLIQQDDIRYGESWDHGTVILSWKDVLRGAANSQDGRNLVFHEFAHQLDSEGGMVNGAPYLPERSMYQTWAEVFQAEYRALTKDLEAGRRNLLGTYSAENPAEFFAVSTELFFERPRALKDRHPKLYQQLVEFYQQDPVAYLNCYRGS
jgi:Mlc titration factor MtfA (ptsG expression regulator)